MGKKLPSRRETLLEKVRSRCSLLLRHTLIGRKPDWKLLSSVDTGDSEKCIGHWEQTIYGKAQFLWPTGTLEIGYTMLVETKQSTSARTVTYYAYLLWKKELDAPHNAFTTLQRVHLNLPEEYAKDQRLYAIRNVLLEQLDEKVTQRLKEKFPSNLEASMIAEWSKMEGGKAPPAYQTSSDGRAVDEKVDAAHEHASNEAHRSASGCVAPMRAQ